MMSMVLIVEIFLIFKHGAGCFEHAYFDWLGYLFMGSLILFFLFLLLKVMISDVINLLKKKNELGLVRPNLEKIEVKSVK